MKARLRYLLRKYGVKPRKRWSQHFLVSPSVIRDMASSARGRVLEIGPGLGFITAELAKRADKVIAVEKDRKFVKILQKEYNFHNVDIIEGDITRIELPPFDRVISNIPYHLSSEIVFSLLEYPFELGVLSFQKEFAQRLVADIPSPLVSRLSLMAQTRAECTVLRYVSREAYYPVPQTDCALVRVVPRHVEADPFFDAVVRALYTHKRKTVRNALQSSKDIFPSAPHVPVPCGERRVWSLTLEEVTRIVEALRAEGFLCSKGEGNP